MPKEQQINEDVFEQFNHLVTQLNLMKAHVSMIQQNVKQLEKSIKKQMKGNQLISQS